ncbi:hypothetical protein [Patiriisocius hiemis]|uniref:HEPN domain-containing protein n=1 Tax=Patiriisocius hiemis TaxID=3075604 RepID=A0ABU2YFJ9_9FLAO|nr:hypothetical protein [Constantimarinum sp. W242]MDT0556646.1 hypothetical protein [Constantimarinum sp. W242]
MNSVKQKLEIAIERSEAAYELYIENKLFFQANRIYKANLVVYNLLNEYVFSCSKTIRPQVYNYIFHLEDWFGQFEYTKEQLKTKTDEFAFVKWNGAISFPISFLENLKKEI